MSNAELKRYLTHDLRVKIPAGLTQRDELVDLALSGRPSKATVNLNADEDVSEHLLEA